MVNPITELANDDLVILTTELADENLVNPTTELGEDNETAITTINAMMNSTINILDLKFDEESLANDEWLQVMQQKHHIDMMIFGEVVEDELFASAQVNK